MPYPLGAVTVQGGQTYIVPVGSTSTVGAVVVANESPFSLQVSANSSGAGGQWVVAQTVDLVACDTPGFNGALSITTSNYLANATNAPSFVVYLTAYAPGEPIRGTYPASLSRLTNGVLNVTAQVINTNNAVGSQIVQASPQGGSGTYISINNDGTADWYVAQGSQLDAGHKLHILQVNNNVASLPYNLALFGSTGVGAPNTLMSGKQETGFCGVQGYNTAGNSNGVAVNFKTVMVNTPTSVTLSATFTSNTNFASGNNLNTYGFWFFYPVTATGLASWFGTYTTVGNCLLAVHAVAGTFDHHCDNCGAVNAGQLLSSMQHVASPTSSSSSMAFACPHCGTVEVFNCALTPTDEADTSPQGSGQYATTRGAQASLIRSLMTALGLPVL